MLPECQRGIEWGTCPAEVTYRMDEEGTIRQQKLIFLELGLARAYQDDRGEIKAIEYRGDWIPSPFCMWVKFGQSHTSRFYGRPRVRGAFAPWLEMDQNGGGRDIRILWYHRCAFRGAMMRFPMNTGKIDMGDGRMLAPQQYAMEILDK